MEVRDHSVYTVYSGAEVSWKFDSGVLFSATPYIPSDVKQGS